MVHGAACVEHVLDVRTMRQMDSTHLLHLKQVQNNGSRCRQ
jgi:hypothetical protein